jgi:hypothetical protein
MPDGQGNLYLSQTRIYDSIAGIWGTVDPDAYVNGLNDYQFELGNSVNLQDPSGLESERMHKPTGEQLADADYRHRHRDLPDPGTKGFNPLPPDFKDGTPVAHEGQPCDCPSAKLTRFLRTDEGGQYAGDGKYIIDMSVDLQLDGAYRDLQIAWWTCWRPDGTSGYIPGAAGSRNAAFEASAWGMGMYTTHVMISYLSCEGGHWKHYIKTVGADYYKKYPWTGYKRDHY